MPTPRVRHGYRPSLLAILFCCLMVAFWIAGGASRPDVYGQVVVRFVATVTLVLALLMGPRPALARAKPVLLLLTATILLALIQLVPLPPAIWQSLPGRAPFAAAAIDGVTQPWRPWAIVPGAALNAAGSLIVPLGVLVVVAMMPEREQRILPFFVLGMIAAAALLSLLQFSGVRFDNPLINEGVGQVSGNFSNRNHFALFLAFGFLLTPVCALGHDRVVAWRAAVGVGLMLVFALLVLAIGSRAGLLASVIALAIGLILARSGLRRLSRRLPKWALPAALVAFAIMLVGSVIVSMAAQRAVAIDRLFAIDLGQDMRSRGLPIVLDMIRTYFPAGAGLGGFDPIFRLHEPLTLLKPTYFNHAHNDFLEVALDTGLPGLLLLVTAIGWWIVASVRVWTASSSREVTTGRLGSTMVLLVLVASAFDYPARTPMMMAMIVISAWWLSQSATVARRAALPAGDPHL